MKYSMSDIRASLSHTKKREDSLVAILFHRPLSYPITFAFVNAGVSAWTVSVLSAIVAIIACVLIGVNEVAARWLGLGLLNLWAILDCVDGNVARVTETQSDKGAFMDAESGYMVCAFVYLAFGVAAYYSSERIIIDCPMYICLGGLASISDLLARLIHQKYQSTVTREKSGSEGKKSRLTLLRKRVSTEVGIAGFVLVGSLVAQLFNLYDALVLFYSLFNILMLMSTVVIYSAKARS